MTSKGNSSPAVDDSSKGPKEKVFKSPISKHGPLQPLQNFGKPIRGSFISRGESSLGKIAQFSKRKEEAVGTGAKGNNFVFARMSPKKDAEEETETQTETQTRVKQQPPAKKLRVSRTLDESSKGTIFNLL